MIPARRTPDGNDGSYGRRTELSEMQQPDGGGFHPRPIRLFGQIVIDVDSGHAGTEFLGGIENE
jgi:hypothetical protein